jgi:hypothetical protein
MAKKIATTVMMLGGPRPSSRGAAGTGTGPASKAGPVAGLIEVNMHREILPLSAVWRVLAQARYICRRCDNVFGSMEHGSRNEAGHE